MEHPDERLYELEISLCDDGDILIEQGRCACGCGDDVLIRLHRSQLPLIANIAGFVSADSVTQAAAPLRDRINIMASLVRAHTQPGEPLRIVVDDLMGGVVIDTDSDAIAQHELVTGTNGAPVQQSLM